MLTLATVRLRNHCSERCWSHSLPLNDSSVPFCHGLPGSLSAVSTGRPATSRGSPGLQTRVRCPSATNRLDLPEVQIPRAPWRLTSCVSTSMTRPERIRPARLDRQAFPHELVTNCQAFRLAAVRADVEHESYAPHVIDCRRREQPRPARRDGAAGPLSAVPGDASMPDDLALEEDADGAVSFPRPVHSLKVDCPAVRSGHADIEGQ